jgi:hypothetical protein
MMEQTGKAYWICGLMAEKLWSHFSIFINFENIFDTRQTKFDTIYTAILMTRCSGISMHLLMGL